jgi:hypothetical protein
VKAPSISPNGGGYEEDEEMVKMVNNKIFNP